MKKLVVCLSCHKKVEVTLIPHGKGHIAACPECHRLAYNGSRQA